VQPAITARGISSSWNWFCTRTCVAGRPHVWLCHARLVMYWSWAGWTRGSSMCYLVISERLIWNAAEQQCQVLGGHLTSVDSKEHVDWLWKLARRRHFWIGQSMLGNGQNPPRQNASMHGARTKSPFTVRSYYLEALQGILSYNSSAAFCPGDFSCIHVYWRLST